MIPTIGTNSLNNISNNNINNSSNQTCSSVMIGIASLILEGRAISDDEFVNPSISNALMLAAALKHQVQKNIFDDGAAYGGSGCQSPCTSSSWSSNFSIKKTNHNQMSDSEEGVKDTKSIIIESNHERLTEKICQLRQSSPSIIRDTYSPISVEQQFSIQAKNSAISSISSPEKIALKINQDSCVFPSSSYSAVAARKTAELDRRIPIAVDDRQIINKSPPISENFLYSLQSLATTCLRGNNGNLATESYQQISSGGGGGGVGNYRYNYLSSSPTKKNITRSSNHFATNLSSPPRCAKLLSMPPLSSSPSSVVNSNIISGSASSSRKNKFFETNSFNAEEIVIPDVQLCTAAKLKNNLMSIRFAAKKTINNGLAVATEAGGVTEAIAVTPIVNTTTTTTTSSTTPANPQRGPHCDQFLKKMGLSKAGEVAEAEDHICDTTHANSICSHWRIHCIKMEEILSRSEAICIEVYLGPVNHKILLEQWIITQKDKKKLITLPTMTLPSLCSAIRSQLYFSQISAWCDLIKKSDRHDIMETGRIKIYGTTRTGIKATGTGETSNIDEGGDNLCCRNALHHLNSIKMKRPHLNIYYNIKQYDSTASFNNKPNVHNFPDVIIGDNCSISVCLKSLPRINGGIPRINVSGNDSSTFSSSTSTLMTSIIQGTAKTLQECHSFFDERQSHHCNQSTSSLAIANKSYRKSLSLSSPSSSQHHQTSSSLTNDKLLSCTGKGKHKCFLAEKEDGEDNNDDSGNIDNDFVLEDNDGEVSSGERFKSSLVVVPASGCNDARSCSPCDSNESTISSMSLSSNLTHREKQLIKYRKRMLKRDKRATTATTSLKTICCSPNEANNLIAIGAATGYSKSSTNKKSLPMQLDVKFNCENLENSKNSINSLDQPLYQKNDNNFISAAAVESIQQQQKKQKQQSDETVTGKFLLSSSSSSTVVEMISTGTQTIPMSWNYCNFCGNEQSFICLNCDKNCDDMGASKIVTTTKKKSLRHDRNLFPAMITTTTSKTLNKAELLLQAIQRTPRGIKKKKTIMHESDQMSLVTIHHPALETCDENIEIGNELENELCTNSGSVVAESTFNDCQVCKRQKTKHHFHQKNAVDGGSDEVEAADSRIGLVNGTNHNNNNNYNNNNNNITNIVNSTKSPKNDDNDFSCDCSGSRMDDDDDEHGMNSTSKNGINTAKLQINSPCFSGAIEQFPTDPFKTPNKKDVRTTEKASPSSPPPPPCNRQIKPNLLQISTAYNCNNGIPSAKIDNGTRHALQFSLRQQKSMPKVNLTPIFCSALTADDCGESSSPLFPSPGKTRFNFDQMKNGKEAEHFYSTSDNNNIPVQKSYSAPTLPNSPSSLSSLSPRFAKQTAIYKRRSRHLSDRSDRSSLGSDEQFSDEDFENSCFSYGSSPVTSPMKTRQTSTTSLASSTTTTSTAAVVRCNAFGRNPLIGNLEESLLQKRLIPKIEVSGFKVLLGASGGFCPTQLTIPAAAYFYELHGQTLNTPYVCEIRLPRKGYSIPRAGTVQVTLLNPMGTVVRMFVIPYDFRDMPSLHQTFIRQRILAETITNTAPPSPSRQNSNGSGSGSDGSNLCVNGIPNCYDNVTSISSRYRLSPNGGRIGLQSESNLGHFISPDDMRRLRYSIHLRFQTSRSGRLSLHTDIRLLISRRTDCDTAAAYAKSNTLEAPNHLIIDTVMPSQPKYSARQENPNKI